MPKQARIGDTVRIDCPHGPTTGIIVTGSDYTFADGISQSRLTDTVVCCKCGQEGKIITGSDYSYADGLPKARVDDITQGKCDYGCKTCPHSRSGVIITGSDFTYTD